MIFYDVKTKTVRQSLGLVLGEFLRLDLSRNQGVPVLMPVDKAEREQWERRLADPKRFWLERSSCSFPVGTNDSATNVAEKIFGSQIEADSAHTFNKEITGDEE